MLLTAFLAFNHEFSPLLSTSLLREHDEKMLAEAIPRYRALETFDFDTHAGSLWWCRRPPPAALDIDPDESQHERMTSRGDARIS